MTLSSCHFKDALRFETKDSQLNQFQTDSAFCKWQLNYTNYLVMTIFFSDGFSPVTSESYLGIIFATKIIVAL